MACRMRRASSTAKKYFAALLQNADGMSEQLHRLLSFNRSQMETLTRIDRAIIAILLQDPLLCDRVQQLRTVDGGWSNRAPPGLP